MVDTANTLCEGAKALKEQGAEKVLAYCTHPVLSGPAVERISSSVLDELVVTDTIPLREDARNCKKIRVLTGRGPAGRDDAPDQRRSIGQFAVRRIASVFSFEVSF